MSLAGITDTTAASGAAEAAVANSAVAPTASEIARLLRWFMTVLQCGCVRKPIGSRPVGSREGCDLWRREPVGTADTSLARPSAPPRRQRNVVSTLANAGGS